MAEAEAAAAGLRREDAPSPGGISMEFAFRLPAIAVVLAGGLVLRLLVAFLQAFQIDTGTFHAWSNQLATSDPWNFYETDFFTDYAPGYMYVLWLFGELNQVFNFSLSAFEYLLKLPSIAADVASAYLLYLFLKDQRPIYRVGAAALYLVFPPVLLIGPIWGQVDSLLAFFLLLSIYFIGRERPVAGALAYTIGFLIKPQIIAALPFLAFWIMRRCRSGEPIQPSIQLITGLSIVAMGIAGLVLVDEEPRAAYRLVFGGVTAVGAVEALRGIARMAMDTWESGVGFAARDLLVSFPSWYQAVGFSLALAIVLIIPFFTYKPWQIIGQLYEANEVYPVNSFFAYNFWNIGGLFEGFKPDIGGTELQPNEGTFLGIDHRLWGGFLFAVASGVIVFTMRKSEGSGALALGTALCVLVFYLFMTRMHERYLFAFFLPFLAAAVALHSRILIGLFAALGTIHFLNLYHVYVYYQCDPTHQCELKWSRFYRWFEQTNNLGTGLDTVQVLSILLVAALPILIAAAYAVASRARWAGAT